MAWQLQLGIDIDLLKKTDAAVRDRQIRILSILSIMLILIGLLCTFSTIIYVLIIFHNWFIAIGSGFFMGLVSFNLYRLLVMTAMDGSGTVLGEYMSDHEKHILEHIDHDTDISGLSDTAILEKSAVAKQQLREKPLEEKIRSSTDVSVVLTMALRVVILSILALIFAGGIEIFIFKDPINTVLSQMKAIYASAGDTWMVEQVLTPAPDDEFYIIQSNSLLMVLEVLDRGLGAWKAVIDLLFLILFLIPLAIVFRSKEVYRGEYMKEFVLSSVTISFYHYMGTRKYCQKLNDLFSRPVGTVDELKSSSVP